MNVARAARPRVVIVIALAFAALWLSAPALAHTSLVASNPEPGDQVEALDEVLLEFSDAVLDIGTQISIVHADGTESQLDASYPEPHLVAADVPELVAGPHQVVWRVVAEDGHEIEGTLDFEVLPAQVPDPTPTEDPVAEPSEDPEASPSAPGTPAPAVLTPPPDEGNLGNDAGSNVSPLAAVGIAAAGAALIAVAWLITRGMAARRESAAQ